MNKKRIKKMVSALTVASILGTSIATPLNVMSTEAFADETRAISYDTSNIFQLSTSKFGTDVFKYVLVGFSTQSYGSMELTKWSADNEWGKIAGDSTRLGLLQDVDGTTAIGLAFHRADAGDQTIYARYTATTQAGKKYYISYDLLDSQSITTTEKAGDHSAVVRVKDVYGTSLNEKSYYFANAVGGKKTMESGGFTFTAGVSYSELELAYSTTRTTMDDNNNQVWLKNVQIREDFSDQAKDMLNNLFTAADYKTLKSDVTQADVDEVQAIINAVVVPENKTALQNGLDTAQSLLDTKNGEAAAAEQAKQTAAKQAVDALFNNNNPVNNPIKATTTQQAIDDAQKLVDAITDSVVKAARQADLDRAQSLLNTKNEAMAEQARQTAAKQAVDALFNNNTPTSNAIKATTTQQAIDDAQKLVDAITDSVVKAARQADLDKAQSLLDTKNEAMAEQARQTAAKQAVDALFNNNTPTSNAIKATTTQKAIDDAQKLVDAITDSVVKAARQADLDKAQSLLDAKNEAEAAEQAKQTAAKQAVDALFNNNTPTSNAIKATTTQQEIDDAQKLVDAITDSVVKAARQADLDKAQSLLDAKNEAMAEQARQTAAKQAVDALFNNNTPTSNAIKATTTQKAIDDAQRLVDAITDSVVKAARQADLDRAQNLLDTKNEAVAADQTQKAVANYAVNQLFISNTPTTDTIKTATNQESIDSAQAEINKINDPTLKTDLQITLDRAQELLDERNAVAKQVEEATKAVGGLFSNDTPTSNAIKPTTTQKAIDDAQKLVDAIVDSAVKEARQAELDKAQELLDTRTAQAAADQTQKAVANYAINQLFVSNNPTSDAIKASTDQDAIDNVQAEIDKLNDPALKTDLQTTLDRAQELLNERNEVAKQVEEAQKVIDELFNNGALKDTTDQAAIDKAQEKIDALTDADKKTELQKALDAAQKQLDDRNSAAEAEKERQEKAAADVKNLFENGNTNGALKDTTDQAAIDKAQEAIDAVTNPTVKESLQEDLDKAQALLVRDKITNIDTHYAGTGYVTGKTSPGVTRVGLFVNGVLVKTAAASNGEFRIYAGGTPEMKIAGQIFEIAALTSTGVAGVKTASIVSPKVNPKLTAPAINEFYKGEGYVTGTVPTGATKVALYIDGTFIRYGVITGNDFKIYGNDVAHLKTHGKEFHVLVEDATGQQSDLTASTVKLKDTTVTPDDVTTKSSYLTGSVLSDHAKRIALYVDGEFIRHGAITADGYRVYIYDVKALKEVGAEYEIHVLDSGNNVLTSITETVK
ncbi:toxin Cry1Ac domain D-VI-related protein [Listeria booriae]|uniref:Pesticidal crystal protein Cry1Aa domain-containing protein n=1 Tax=Listeria booriae TaxID=1552123 RepID=A0A7X1DK39_9LIST|nr:toxin Cry1Ac domain D-VI-related protein [Listeria booriae]MBC2283863.1 hypothetical protein [Listeria booriae]MBC2291637.1 hypothetical protein [Listeria booriae]MBC2310558.1 hypothetical protein [Listeria booriae]